MKLKSITLKPEPVTTNITPFGFFHYGKEFLDATKGFVEPLDYSPVPYYLYCHSIELFLKAFLLVKGVDKKDLKDMKEYGHDLEKILKKAQKLGLIELVKITPKQEKEIQIANKYYKYKGFEYLEVIKAGKGYQILPDLTVLKKVASELETNLKIVCLNLA